MVALEVRDQSQVAEARRLATTTAAASGCGPTSSGRVAIVATELATNLLKHGGGGELLLSTYEAPGSCGVQLLALDSGKGMPDVQACLRDGYSTAGSAGHGLGSVRRQSELFDVFSLPGLGTAVLSRVSSSETFQVQTSATARSGFINVPKPGEEVSGDALSIAPIQIGLTMLVADGLGHGQEAAVASLEAVRLFQRHAGLSLTELLELMHAGMRATRGAAAAIVRFDPAQPRVSFAGVGNVAGIVHTPGQARHMVSMNGTLGHNARKVQAFDYPCPAGSLVILHSDGLSTSWSLDKYPGLRQRDPTLIAAVLYRDHARRRDDATVLVTKV
ncbi:MAG: ATP-binding SpoIIE family protein phosphatase [Steroidobacteraceae bacterium]